MISSLYITLLRWLPSCGLGTILLAPTALAFPPATEVPLDHPITEDIPTPDAILDRAHACVGAQDYPCAAQRFLQYLELSPTNLGVRLELARVYAWSERYEDAVREYDYLHRKAPFDRELSLERDRVLLWAGHYVDAIISLAALRSESSPSPGRQSSQSPRVPAQEEVVSLTSISATSDDFYERVTRVLADGYAWSGAEQRALPLYRSLWEHGHDDRSLGLAYARILAGKKAYSEAIEVYDTLLAQTPSDNQLRLERARVLLWAERYIEGLACLIALREECLEGQTAQHDAHAVQDDKHAVQDDAHAVQDDAHAVQDDKHPAQDVETTQDDAHAVQDDKHAVQDDEHATQDDARADQLDEIDRLLAFGYYWSGDLKSAATRFSKLIQDHPRDEDLLLEFARVLLQAKRMQEAAVQYRLYLALVPDDLLAGVEHARALLWAEQYSEATRSCLRLNAQLEDPLTTQNYSAQQRAKAKDDIDRMLARALLGGGQPGLALPLIRSLIALHQDDAGLELDLAQCLGQLGELDAAWHAFARYREKGGSPTEAALAEGQMLHWQGGILKARAQYRRAIRSSPSSEEAASRLANLEPLLTRPWETSVRWRGDVDGFAQETLVSSLELPLGLVWTSPQAVIDRFGGGAYDIYRFSPIIRARYWHNANWEFGGRAGFRYLVNKTVDPMAPLVGARARWLPQPRLIVTFNTGLSDADEVLFTRPSLEAGVRQLDFSSSLDWIRFASWEAWAQARVTHLFRQGGGLPNYLLQVQGSLEKHLLPDESRVRLRLAAVGGGLHVAHEDSTYWSPRLYLTAGVRATVETILFGWLNTSAGAKVGMGYSTEISELFPEVSGKIELGHHFGDKLSGSLEADYGQTVRNSLDTSEVLSDETSTRPRDYGLGHMQIQMLYLF